MNEQPELLVLIPLAESTLTQLRRAAAPIALRHAPQGLDWQDPALAGVRYVLTNGSTGLSAAQMQALPSLQWVAAFGAGYENIDLPAAQQRKLWVTHASGANDATVADHAMALLLGIARGVHLLDGAVKAGQWDSVRSARPAIHGKRLGLIGLGNIGAKIARRASGFDMEIGYHTRQPRAGLPYRHFPDALALAAHSDYLVLACPGGQATRHLVDAAVLEALGPQGFLINIARGSVVDTAALVSALQTGGIAGAALDVFEGEPVLPAAMSDLPNLLLTPHVSGRSPESQQAQVDMFLACLAAVTAGAAPPHQVRP